MTDRDSPLCLLLVALIVGFGFSTGRSSDAADDLSRYYDGLRQRGLFRVAESDCLRRLSDDQTTPGDRAELTIELSRSYADHARSRGGQEQDELWSRAGNVIDELLAANPTPPFRVMLEAQRAFVLASRGAQLRWQVELYPLDRRKAEEAARVLQRAIKLLSDAPETLVEQTRVVADRVSKDTSQTELLPSVQRMREVRQTVEFRLAVAGVDLGTVLPEGAERDAVIHEAETRLKELVNTPRPDDRTWRAGVLFIQLLRLQGDLERVDRRVEALLAKDPPPSVRDAAIAELVRSQLERQQPDAAIETLQAHRQEHGLESSELKCLVVETLLVARNVAFEKEQTDTAADMLAKAETFAVDIEGAWGARSRVLLNVARESDIYGPQLATTVRQARWAWKNGDLDLATSSYRRATAEAHREGRADFAVEFGLKLATLQTQTSDFKAAIDTLNGLLSSYPSSEKAAEADLLRAYAHGKEFEQQPDDAHQRAYRTALKEHQVQYSDSPTTAEASWMLARLNEYDRDWSAAISELKLIPLTSKRGSVAASRVAVLYEQMLNEIQQRGDSTHEVQQRAIADLTSIVEQLSLQSHERSPKQADVIVSLARLLLQQESPNFVSADSLLAQVLAMGSLSENSDSPLIKPATSATASQLRIISLAGQGRLEDAAALLDGMADESPERMLAILNGLTTAAEQVAIQHQPAVSRLQLDISQRLEKQRDSLSPETQVQLDESLAQSYAAIGQVPKAASLYEKLIWQQPKNLSLIKSLATLYETCGSASCLRNAIEQWQKLEHQQKKGTVDWLESRYHLALCSHLLADDATARKLVGVTRVLYPNLGTPQLKRQFEELSADLKLR